jgi:hypothetical protein
MLELLRCAFALDTVKLEEGDDKDFLNHACAVFNQEFKTMHTELHTLALFLHPLCRKLALNQSIKEQTLDSIMDSAIKIAMQWK